MKELGLNEHMNEDLDDDALLAQLEKESKISPR
jgi:hypothetical protein